MMALGAAFDHLGAELYLRPDGIVASGTDVTAWTNEGTAASLTVDVASNAPQKGADHVIFDGTNYLETTGSGAALDLADGDSLDVVVVIEGDAVGLRAVWGGAGGTPIRVAPRFGGASQFVVVDEDAGVSLELGSVLSTGTVYAVRASIVGSAQPTDDEMYLRINDSVGAPATYDHSAITWSATKMRLGIITGSSFSGKVYCVMAKVGGFSSGDLAILTSRINADFGLSLTSV